MDDRNLNNFGQTLMGINQHLGRLQAWTRAAVRRQLNWEGYDVNLTVGQANALRSTIENRLARVQNAANGLEAMTGFVGVPAQEIVDRVQAEPETLARVLSQAVQQLQALTRQPELQADDTMRFEIDDESAQQLAHLAATIRDCVAIVVGVLRARLQL